MPLDNPQGGFGYAAEFQSSALPWVTSSLAPAKASPVEVDFNYITRFISLTNLDPTNNLFISFTLLGMASSNYATVLPKTTLTLEWRVAKVWIAAASASLGYTLDVGLTTVPARQMPLLTGSFPDGTNWAGVG